MKQVNVALTLIGGFLCSALAPSIRAQGNVLFINTHTTLVSTNSTGSGGTAGLTANTPSGFIYGLFLASSNVTSLSAGDLLTPTWTFTGDYATNGSVAGELFGAIGPVTLWNGNMSFVVAGWSTDVASSDWASVATQLAGATFANGLWSGPNWLSTSYGGFFGVSSVGTAYPPGPDSGLPAMPLFGAPGSGLISSGFYLYEVVPEPSEPALIGLGICSLLALRRWRRSGSRIKVTAQ